MNKFMVVLCLVSVALATSPTIQQLTEGLMSAFARHDLDAIERMMDTNIVIQYNTELPAGGLYKGHKGFRAFHESAHALCDKCECTPRLDFVTEGSGYAGVRLSCCGTFLRTNKPVTAQKYVFLRWELGKLALLSIADENYAEIVDAYRTDAEKAWYKLSERLALTGASGDALDLVSNDATFELDVYPRALLNALGLTNLLGKDGFTTLHKKISALIRHPLAVEVVYANDTHVNVATLLGDTRLITKAQWFAPAGRVARDSRLTVLLCQYEFRDGLLVAAKACLNRPMLPKQLFNLQRMLAGKSTGSCGGDCHEDYVF